MKRNFKVVISFLLLVPLFFSFNSLETSAATWSNWQTVSGSCKVRVSTDYSTYTSRANSIDVQAQSSNCSRMDYYVDVWGIDSTGYDFMIDSISQQTGYFSYLTPVKKLSLSKLNYSTKAKVRVLVRGPKGNVDVWSKNIMIYR
ncbi:hypothetical protein SH601_14225 [Gracilibacillus sp. S3-1-1]|uniref:Uncharacterized protein n=1 Tax=Gracilibacillus pellucidus TaxID=3095368 RepID=A0ACC6M847_9BACI|nr:hypothetical protein [Gracilibacillus sp. S3-1-1]MDX8047145.1 hypothetical protein [Gracilibacillus sp. S3-1-1]